MAVCAFASTAHAEIELGWGEMTPTGANSGIIEVTLTNAYEAVSGFQFSVTGATLLEPSGATGGVTSGGDWTVATSENGVVGLNTAGGFIGPGEHLLTRLSFTVGDQPGALCFADALVADPTVQPLSVASDTCYNLGAAVALENVDGIAGTADVVLASPFIAISGFQFSADGVTLASVTGGVGDISGWDVTTSAGAVLAVDTTGEAALPPGTHSVLSLGFTPVGTSLCIEGLVVGDETGAPVYTGDDRPCASLFGDTPDLVQLTCTDDSPYVGLSVSGFLPGLFPGDSIPLCTVQVADVGDRLDSLNVTLFGASLATPLVVYDADFTDGPPVQELIPICGQGVSTPWWETDREPACAPSGRIVIGDAAPGGTYSLRYAFTVRNGTETVDHVASAGFVRIDLEEALHRASQALTAYSADGGVLRHAAGALHPDCEPGEPEPEGTAGSVVDRDGDSVLDHCPAEVAETVLSLFAHIEAALSADEYATLLAAASDAHSELIAVRNEILVSGGPFYAEAYGQELRMLIGELYRATHNASHDHSAGFLGGGEFDPTVASRFQDAQDMLGAVDSQSSANPHAAMYWAASRQQMLANPTTGVAEHEIALGARPAIGLALTLFDSILADAQHLQNVIDGSGGRMFGRDENNAVLSQMEELRPYLASLVSGGGSNATNEALIRELLEVLDLIADARITGHLGNDDQFYYVLLAAYVIVENLFPNVAANVCGSTSHPWYEQNDLRWEWLATQLADYQASFDELYLASFAAAVAGAPGDWALYLPDAPSEDPRWNTVVADTSCGIRYLYNAAYTAADGCYFAETPADTSDCPPLEVDYYPTCGGGEPGSADCP